VKWFLFSGEDHPKIELGFGLSRLRRPLGCIGMEMDFSKFILVFHQIAHSKQGQTGYDLFSRSVGY